MGFSLVQIFENSCRLLNFVYNY